MRDLMLSVKTCNFPLNRVYCCPYIVDGCMIQCIYISHRISSSQFEAFSCISRDLSPAVTLPIARSLGQNVVSEPVSGACHPFIHFLSHYDDVIMNAIASQITSLTNVYSIVYSDADQRKHQSSASLAFVWGIHRGPVNSPHKWPVTWKMFPFDDVIIVTRPRSSLRTHRKRPTYNPTYVSFF